MSDRTILGGRPSSKCGGRPPGAGGAVAESRDVLARAASEPDAVVHYGPGPEQLADLRFPDRGPAPLLVLLHGGFWRPEWDRRHTRPMADGLAAAGFAVATPEYARTGHGGWSRTAADVARAVAALPDLVAAVRPDVVHAAGAVLVGHSAGGQLTLWCASSGLPAPYVGVVAIAPVADLTAAHRLDLDAGAVAALLGGSPEEVPDRYAAADPCRLTPPALPVVVVHGARDEQVPLELSQRYAAQAGADLRVLPSAGHFDLIDPNSPSWLHVLESISDLCYRPPPR
ncbi:MAG: prolyl oligopeptidase family serine peptidase [Jiangellaceae bacterium]|nr:prolyl oligopeptidase family serine peptidase [Jiangellaceae bacterium]